MQSMGGLGLKKRNRYYFDYSQEAYQYIMVSKLLRQSEKDLLRDIVNGKTVKELSINYKCSEMTICRRRKKIFEITQEFMNYEPVEKIIEKSQENEIGYKVYLLTFPNNKIYIGMTGQDENKRWQEGKGYSYNKEMYDDIIKFGWNNIKKNVLYKNLSQEEAKEKEKELIIHYKSHLKNIGYNKSF